MLCLLLLRIPSYFSVSPFTKKSFLFMNREGAAYFLIKPCSVCLSQLLNTWVTSSTDGQVKKKIFRLAPPPHPNYELLRTPPPLFLVCIVNLKLVSEAHLFWKAHWAQLPLFHQIPHWYSCVSSCSHLGADRKHHRPVSRQAPPGDELALRRRTLALHF